MLTWPLAGGKGKGGGILPRRGQLMSIARSQLVDLPLDVTQLSGGGGGGGGGVASDAKTVRFAGRERKEGQREGEWPGSSVLG